MTSVGNRIRSAREARGWSQARLAAALSQATGRDTVDRHYVSRWERGERTPRYWLPVVARVLRLSLAELEQASARPLVISSDGLVDSTAPSSPLPRRRLPNYTEERLEEIVEHLREQWHWLVKTDNLLGPCFALAGVLSQLEVIEVLLATDLKSQWRNVVQLGSRYAESAAWLYEDSGRLPQARHWTSRSLEWAYEAFDNSMLAWTFFRRSQLAGRVRDVVQVVRFAQTARRDEDQLLPPMRAAIRVQEARGHAMNGDESTAQRLLEEAHAWATADTIGDARGGHGSFCTPGYIELNRAAVLAVLGKPNRAISVYEKALPTLPAVYERDRAAALSGMATAYAAAGEPSQAASTAIQSLRAARAAGSARIVNEVELVGRALASHRGDQMVNALLDELATESCPK